MGRKILGFLTSFLIVLSLSGIFAIIYAENHPDGILKPRLFTMSVNSGDIKPNGSEIKTETPQKTNEAPMETPSGPPSHVEMNVPMIFQKPLYPTGCEPVSAVMLLNYYGYDITVDEFIEKMPHGNYPYVASNRRRYGPDPNEAFVGDPRDPSSWGIFAEGIKNIMNSILVDSACRDITGCSLEMLYQLLAEGKPVIVWATIKMQEPLPGISWYLENSEELFIWPKREHCYVLVGYDRDGNFIFNDPLEGRVKHSREVFLKAFESLGRQALYVDKPE